MSLLNRNKPQEAQSAPQVPDYSDREPRTTESKVREKDREANRIYQKELRARHLDNWRDEKAKIDAMSIGEVAEYIETSEPGDQRVGLHAMKVNPHEHAVIKLAQTIMGARSSRDMFVKYCKQVIKDNAQ